MLKKKRTKSTNLNKNNSFLFKLYDILKDPLCKGIINWNNNGTGILIKDRYKICEIVLPKYFKHNNYSSFIRQLNLYGFYKSKGMIKEGDLFEHEKLNNKSTKEEIGEIISQFKKNKFFFKLVKNNSKEEELNTNNNDSLSNHDDGEILKYLIEKNEENVKNIIELREEIKELKAENMALNQKLGIFNNIFNGHNIFLQKLIKQKNQKIINKDKQKPQNIKDLFNKYLYYLRIYSPYLPIKKETNSIMQKMDSFNIINTNSNLKDININDSFKFNINNNIHNINSNSNSFLSTFSFINQRPDIHSFLLNLHNNNSNSFFYNNKNLNNDNIFLKHN